MYENTAPSSESTIWDLHEPVLPKGYGDDAPSKSSDRIPTPSNWEPPKPPIPHRVFPTSTPIPIPQFQTEIPNSCWSAGDEFFSRNTPTGSNSCTMNKHLAFCRCGHSWWVSNRSAFHRVRRLFK